ncbi:MAG TPA: hypothetical protein VGQ57_06625 [Polyangiaceae bacterium]|jgi:hypothetical protein|nr:hypothetical protein [Polyangiaceae bacterium]
MNRNSWRELLKSGPLSGAYAELRKVKRRLLREPLGGVIPVPATRWTVEQHEPLIRRFPEHGRLHFSLGIAHLERGAAGDLQKARDAFRSAKERDFESPERLALYDAIVTAREGDPAAAKALLVTTPLYEFTEAELALLRAAAGTGVAEAHG